MSLQSSGDWDVMAALYQLTPLAVYKDLILLQYRMILLNHCFYLIHQSCGEKSRLRKAIQAAYWILHYQSDSFLVKMVMMIIFQWNHQGVQFWKEAEM